MITTLFLATSLWAQDVEAAAKLAEVGKVSAASANYTFSAESALESQYVAGTARPRGRFEKGVGLYMKMEDLEVVRAGGKTVVKNLGADWGSPKDEPGAPFSMKRTAAKHFPAPHEITGRMESKHFKSVTIELATDYVNGVECVVFLADLNEEGARSLSGMPPDLTNLAKDFTGTLKVWVDDKYQILRYKLDAKAVVRLGGMEMPATIKATVDFEGIGTTKVDLPEGAKKALP